jgi:anti-sigma B factor antagonist
VISDEAVWSLEAVQDGAATVLYPRGELDLDTAPRLLAEVGRRVDLGARRLVVDLAGLTFVDSTGLGTIVGCWRRASRATATFELVNPSPYVVSTLKITGLDAILPVALS